MHPHKDVKILMIPLSGAIAHEDSLGNKGVIRPDDVMMMSAGSGIRLMAFIDAVTGGGVHPIAYSRSG